MLSSKGKHKQKREFPLAAAIKKLFMGEVLKERAPEQPLVHRVVQMLSVPEAVQEGERPGKGLGAPRAFPGVTKPVPHGQRLFGQAVRGFW